MAGRRTRRYRARGRIPLRAQARLRQLFRVSRPEVFLGEFVGEWSGRAAKGPGLAATHPWFRRGRSRSACVANGRLRHRRASALRRAPPRVVAANALRHLVELSDRDASPRRAQCRLPARPRCRSSSVRAPHAHPGRVARPRRPPRGLCAGAADRPQAAQEYDPGRVPCFAIVLSVRDRSLCLRASEAEAQATGHLDAADVNGNGAPI